MHTITVCLLLNLNMGFVPSGSVPVETEQVNTKGTRATPMDAENDFRIHLSRTAGLQYTFRTVLSDLNCKVNLLNHDLFKDFIR